MKTKYTLLTVMVLTVNALVAQDVMDKITERTCDCISKKDFSKLSSKDDIQTEAGLCILSAYSEYEPELPKKMKVDFKDQKGLEKLGTEIGIRMATKCPNSLMALAGEVMQDKKEALNSTSQTSVTGTIKSVKADTYQTIVVQDKEGKNNVFIWLTYFPGSDRIVENKDAVVGKEVEVAYTSQEVYYASTNTYATQKVITSVTFK